MKGLKFLFCTVLTLLMLVGMVLPTMAYTGDSSNFYAMYVDEQQVGIVRFAARALSIYDNVEKELREDHEDEIWIDANVYFKEIKSAPGEITDDKALAKAIKDTIDVKVTASVIKIEDKEVCYVKSSEDAQKIVEDIKTPYQEKIGEDEDSQLEEITIKQDVSFEEELVSETNIISSEEAIGLILHGGQEKKDYEVKEGDSLWSIANVHDVEVDELKLANPDIEEELIQPGDVIKVGKEEKLVNVITKEKLKYSEEIDYEKETKEDNTLEKGKTKIIQEGEKGQKDILALVTKEDGQEIDREIVEEEVVKEPVNEIEAIGTKVAPSPERTTNRSRSSSSSSSKSTNSSPSKRSSNTSTTVSRGTTTRKGDGNAVAEYAKQFAGNKKYKYVFGKAGPNNFDCSGFTQYVYKQFGVNNIPHDSEKQRKVGEEVKEKSELRPGDLVCFKGSNHVGIYIGDGKFVHASQPGTDIIISRLSSGRYPQRYVTGRRIFN